MPPFLETHKWWNTEAWQIHGILAYQYFNKCHTSLSVLLEAPSLTLFVFRLWLRSTKRFPSFPNKCWFHIHNILIFASKGEIHYFLGETCWTVSFWNRRATLAYHLTRLTSWLFNLDSYSLYHLPMRNRTVVLELYPNSLGGDITNASIPTAAPHPPLSLPNPFWNMLFHPISLGQWSPDKNLTIFLKNIATVDGCEYPAPPWMVETLKNYGIRHQLVQDFASQ